MEELLLKTKLYIPRQRPEIVSRPRLIERLETGIQPKLTLIAAPAGYGKTTLLSEWVQCSLMPVCWLTLDEKDNDPTRFWLYVISAIQTIKTDIGKSALELLRSSQTLPIESMLALIVNEMSEMSNEFTLVLDDYHLIEDQTIHDAVNFLLNHMPPHMHLAIASRTDPAVSLAQLRAQNQLKEVRTEDLRFIFEESTAFLKDVMSLELSGEDVAALESRTEGWIASLQLAAVSMQGRENISTFIAEFSGSSRFVMDYLIEEVLLRQEENTQSFLLETSILDRFTASLCNAVTGHDASREILAQLETTNMFLVPLDDDRQWYRYHHLFADLLRNQLLQSRPEHMIELHLRASQWFEQEGLIGEAISHALSAKDFDRATNLIESVSRTMIMQSYCLTLLSWMEQLPNSLITNHPWLGLHGARANQFTGHQDAVEPLLQSAESAMSRTEEEHPTDSFLDHANIRSGVRAVRITHALIDGNSQHVIELCHEALKYLPEDDLTAHASICHDLGLAYFVLGELPAARGYLEKAEISGKASGHLYVSLFAMSYLGEIHRVQGQLNQAAQKYREVLRFGSQRDDDEPFPITGNAYVGLSQVLFEWNDIDEAIHHASIGIKLAERGGVVRTLVIGYSMLAWQNQVCGNTEAMNEAIQRVEEIRPETVNAYTLVHASAWKARLSLAQGDLNAVIRWAFSQKSKLNVKDMPDFWSELPYLTLVRLHIAQGKVDEILIPLERLRQKVEAENRTGSLIEILTLQSIALQAQGKINQALATLERALSLAEPEGYVRTFIDEGEPMTKLLHLAVSRGIVRKYARKLLVDLQRTTPDAESPVTASSADGALVSSRLVEPLTQRELEVLRLIITGMSNREIAEKLFIVEGTVKTHINNIFTKLDVQSRTQAIAQARELELL
ncbi:LuxR C-terminal-related transcriptional regulator [Chloroflexota bacterium]